MNVLIQAGEDAERIAAMFQGLGALSVELKRVGSLQQAADEAQGRIDQRKGDLDAANQEVADRVAAGEEASRQLDATRAAIARERAEADAAKRAAEIAAADAVTAAKTEAEQIVTDAKTKAEAQAVAIARRAAADLRATTDELVQKQGLLRAAIDATTEAQSRLDAINAQIADLKARF